MTITTLIAAAGCVVLAGLLVAVFTTGRSSPISLNLPRRESSTAEREREAA